MAKLLIMMEDKNLSFVSLRNSPELLEETANLLNAEWPRSRAARFHYLAENKDEFPCSLILLQTVQHDHPRVIGHSRLNKVLGKPGTAFLTSVLIAKARRGCGLGKKLMELTETHASQSDCAAIYLSTTDKCEFYKHLGYEYCSQVSPMKASSSVFTSAQLSLLQGQSGQGQDGGSRIEKFTAKNEHPIDDGMSAQEMKTILQDCGINHNVNNTDKCNKTCFNNGSFLSSSLLSSSSPLLPKTVSPTQPAPPPPPPLPILPSLQQLTSRPIRTVLAGSFWMMKEL